MNDSIKSDYYKSADYRAAMTDAHARATKTALLEHARMGRSVPQSGPGGTGVVWIAPAEIFARYNLDEFGREKA